MQSSCPEKDMPTPNSTTESSASKDTLPSYFRKKQTQKGGKRSHRCARSSLSQGRDLFMLKFVSQKETDGIRKDKFQWVGSKLQAEELNRAIKFSIQQKTKSSVEMVHPVKSAVSRGYHQLHHSIFNKTRRQSLCPTKTSNSHILTETDYLSQTNIQFSNSKINHSIFSKKIKDQTFYQPLAQERKPLFINAYIDEKRSENRNYQFSKLTRIDVLPLLSKMSQHKQKKFQNMMSESVRQQLYRPYQKYQKAEPMKF